MNAVTDFTISHELTGIEHLLLQQPRKKTLRQRARHLARAYWDAVTAKPTADERAYFSEV